MDEFERRCKQALYQMQNDLGNGVYRHQEYMRILEGRDQTMQGN